MSKIETATQWMENLANDDSHGYDQEDRWGEYGDYDCSSAVISAWQYAGVNVNDATYTGNMYRAFISNGFEDVTGQVNLWTGSGLKRGDVLLNHVNHTAMYVGDGQLVEASINEFGGVTGGAPGDQTGYEIYIHNYYNYTWDCVLRYTWEETPQGEETHEPTGDRDVNVTYQVKTAEDGWLEPVVNMNNTNDDGYAGIIGHAIIGLAVKVDRGSVKYRVHTRHSGWLDYVTGYDLNDFDYGYAGDNTPIDLVEIYYYTPSGEVLKSAKYRVSVVGQYYFPYQTDDDINVGMDGYAGSLGEPIDRIQVVIE